MVDHGQSGTGTEREYKRDMLLDPEAFDLDEAFDLEAFDLEAFDLEAFDLEAFDLEASDPEASDPEASDPWPFVRKRWYDSAYASNNTSPVGIDEQSSGAKSLAQKLGTYRNRVIAGPEMLLSHQPR